MPCVNKHAWQLQRGKYDTGFLRYGRACTLESKENYYTELSNTKTNFNENNNNPLS